MFNKSLLYFFSILIILPTSLFSDDEDNNRGGIEEITVTAEKRTSTVSDTSMSITAFDSSLLEDLGMQGADDLMDQLPATTRDAYDVRIRGVGRNFRALGGDPGVATYYNGIYSPDFGIAASENYLYDVERVEVLRGPQGTLYGRNSIGGAVNFITTKPGDEFAAEIRTLVGSYGVAEVYGFINQPITDNLSARFITVNRQRDGTVKNLGLGEDLDSYEDENYTLALRWQNDDVTVDLRGNNRSYGRVISSAQGAGLIVTSEYGLGTRRNDLMIHGYRAVDPSINCASLTDRSTPNCAVDGY
jgi:outer membrane receptor protein involved in Fe transport